MPPTITPAQCARAASAYRALIRAQHFTFKGDDLALKAAHHQTRVMYSRFVPSGSTSSPTPSPSPSLTSSEIDEYINGAFEIAKYLRRNVVQGIKNEEGNFVLRMTDETERGDNNSIKAPSLKEARPMRPPLEGENAGVRRRRRSSKKEEEALAEAEHQASL